MFNDVKHLDGLVQRSGLSILVNDQVNVTENELAKLKDQKTDLQKLIPLRD